MTALYHDPRNHGLCRRKATIWMAKTRVHVWKVLAQRNCEICQGRDLFRVLKRSPISQLHALGSSTKLFRCEGKRQHDRTPTNIASALESFAATVIMPSAWPDWSKFPFLRSWYDLAEIRTPSNYDLPTRRKASALTAWPHVRLTHASTTKSCRCLSSTSGYVKWIIHAKILPRDLWGPVMQGDLWLVK